MRGTLTPKLLGMPSTQAKPPAAVALRAILDLRPRRRLASIMVGTEGWFL